MKFFLLTVTLFLQTPAPSRPGGVVSGTVFAAGTSEPIPDADVAIATSTAAFETTTDSNGRFSLANVPPGTHILLIRADGFFAAPAAPNAVPQPRAEIPVAVTLGAPSSVTPVAMIRGAIITGKVLDPQGKPLPFAAVQALRPGPAAQLQPVAMRTTDDQGEYRLFWVPPGEYLIGVNPRMPAPANLAVPTVRGPMVRTLFPNTTETAQATKVAVKSGDEIRGIDISARLDAVASPLAPPPPPPPTSGVKVSGQITNALMPSTGTAVLMAGSEKDPGQPRQVGSVLLNGATNSFEIPSVPPGNYDLFVRLPDARGSLGAGGATQAWGRTTLEVRDRPVEGVQMTIHPSVDVPGIVKIDGKPGSPGTSVKVVLSPMGVAGRIPNYRGILDRGQTPREDGKFAIAGAADGNYDVLVQGVPAPLYVADIRQGDTSIVASGIQVREAEPTPFEVLLGSDGGTVEGIVSDKDKMPVGATVVLVPEDRQWIKLSQNATAGPDGRYSIRGVRPGEYKIFAGPPGPAPAAASLTSEMLSKIEAKGVKVTVKAATTTKADTGLFTD